MNELPATVQATLSVWSWGLVFLATVTRGSTASEQLPFGKGVMSRAAELAMDDIEQRIDAERFAEPGILDVCQEFPHAFRQHPCGHEDDSLRVFRPHRRQQVIEFPAAKAWHHD